jgi:hypothetical protein
VEIIVEAAKVSKVAVFIRRTFSPNPSLRLKYATGWEMGPDRVSRLDEPIEAAVSWRLLLGRKATVPPDSSKHNDSHVIMAICCGMGMVAKAPA